MGNIYKLNKITQKIHKNHNFNENTESKIHSVFMHTKNLIAKNVFTLSLCVQSKINVCIHYPTIQN